MSDKYRLKLKNFRSIRDAEVDIAPLTVIYGPNGSGKSSLIYGLLTLKNFLTNPNQNIPSLFSYPTMSLGGFEEVVSGHETDQTVSFSLSVTTPAGLSEFTLGVGMSGGRSTINADLDLDAEPKTRGEFNLSVDIPFPYRADQTSIYNAGREYIQEDHFTIMWNGISVTGEGEDPSEIEETLELLTAVNLPMELAKSSGFTPLRRGFTTSIYNLSNVTPALATDSEVASSLASQRFLEYRVSDYLKTVTDRHIRTRVQPGTASFNIDSIPEGHDVPTSMVNEGFGVNQIAYMLTICLYPNSKIVAIEEPEIHLHPSMVRKLVHAMVNITSNMDKRIIVSTHSETFVLALLAQIAKGKIGVDDVSFILAEKEDGKSRFTKQEATTKGQLQGGLSSFLSSEFEDIAAFLGLDPKTAQS